MHTQRVSDFSETFQKRIALFAFAEEGDLSGLHRYAGYRIAPVRIACAAESANLKCIGRAWRQTINGDGTNDRDRSKLRPRSRFPIGAYRRVARDVAHGFGNRLAADDRLTTVQSVLHLERWRTVERLRRRTDGRGLLLETTGCEDRWIVINSSPRPNGPTDATSSPGPRAVSCVR